MTPFPKAGEGLFPDTEFIIEILTVPVLFLDSQDSAPKILSCLWAVSLSIAASIALNVLLLFLGCFLFLGGNALITE